MIVVILIGISAVLFAYIAQFKRLRFCLKISFLIIFLFLALRYNYGSDYPSYLKTFLDVGNLGFEAISEFWTDIFFYNLIFEGNDELQLASSLALTTEPGWRALCLIFQPFGFFAMIAVLALFNCFVYYYFIKKYVPPAYYWFAVFLYVFTPNMMLVQSSAMRQSLAISIFLLSINYIFKQDFLRYLLLILLATLFHASAIILLPIYLLGMLKFKITTQTAIGVTIFLLSLFILQDYLSPIMSQFIEAFAPKYAIYDERGSVGYGLGIAFNTLIIYMMLIFDRYYKAEESLLIRISVLGAFFIPLSLVIMLIGRLRFYFDPLIFAVYPFILIKAHKVLPGYPLLFKYVFVMVLISYTLFLFWGFFQSDVWKESFGTYNTIFSSPTMY